MRRILSVTAVPILLIASRQLPFTKSKERVLTLCSFLEAQSSGILLWIRSAAARLLRIDA